MKGNSPLFGNKNLKTNTRLNVSNELSVESSYLTSTSINVKDLKYEFKNHINPHDLPIKHTPNSNIEQRDDNGKLKRIRHYDENGNAYKDVDYSDHGSPEKHKIPHTHYIEIINGHIIRKKGMKEHGNS